MHELTVWEARIAAHVRATGAADAAHDFSHVERVVSNARRLGTREQANLDVVVPAAWLHDIVSVRKSKEGKTFGCFCKDGDRLEIQEEQGVPILMHK